jgi:hypothetical protein
LRAQIAHYRDDRNRDSSGNQAILYRRRARVIVGKSLQEFDHVLLCVKDYVILQDGSLLLN